jgi:hypothetical protein
MWWGCLFVGSFFFCCVVSAILLLGVREREGGVEVREGNVMKDEEY